MGLMGLLFLAGLALVVGGWRETGKLMGVAVMLVGVALLLLALLLKFLIEGQFGFASGPFVRGNIAWDFLLCLLQRCFEEFLSHGEKGFFGTVLRMCFFILLGMAMYGRHVHTQL